MSASLGCGEILNDTRDGAVADVGSGCGAFPRGTEEVSEWEIDKSVVNLFASFQLDGLEHCRELWGFLVERSGDCLPSASIEEAGVLGPQMLSRDVPGTGGRDAARAGPPRGTCLSPAQL